MILSIRDRACQLGSDRRERPFPTGSSERDAGTASRRVSSRYGLGSGPTPLLSIGANVLQNDGGVEVNA